MSMKPRHGPRDSWTLLAATGSLPSSLTTCTRDALILVAISLAQASMMSAPATPMPAAAAVMPISLLSALDIFDPALLMADETLALPGTELHALATLSAIAPPSSLSGWATSATVIMSA